jgi:hypothetical protein
LFFFSLQKFFAKILTSMATAAEPTQCPRQQMRSST